MNNNYIILGIIALVVGYVLGMYLPLTRTTNHPTQKEMVFNQETRKLWEDHVTWTRVYIIDSVANLPAATASAQRLLQNQEDIGNSFKPFYGNAAGDKITVLLKQHITGAVTIINAAKDKDTVGLEKATTDWYANGKELADYWNSLNPNWSKQGWEKMMKAHLDLTSEELINRLNKNYEGDVAAYDKVHDEILMMSDGFSRGIEMQFPDKFL